VLAISDSSEINLQSHAGRLSLSGLGVVGNNTDVGFYIHPTLVLDGESGFPLGLSTVKLWSREINHVVCLEQALRMIQWYGWRWKIEQLFATLKKAGLNLEATQLESAIAIQRLTILALSVAVRTL
ncbi:MAG: hypothetical protein ACYTXP_40950, partial [Nostoc sp.]